MDADEEDELRDLLAERNRYIDELEVELSTQEGENDKYRDDLLICQDKIAELDAEAKQLHLDNKDLVDETRGWKNKRSLTNHKWMHSPA